MAGEVGIGQLDGVDQGLDRLPHRLFVALLGLDQFADIAHDADDARHLPPVVTERDLDDLQMARLGTQVDLFLDGDGVALDEYPAVGMFETTGGIVAEDRRIVEPDQLLGFASDGMGEGRIDVAVFAVEILQPDGVGDGVVEAVEEPALLLDLARQGLETLGLLAVFRADETVPEKTEAGAEDENGEGGDARNRAAVTAKVRPGRMVIGLLHDPPGHPLHRHRHRVDPAVGLAGRDARRKEAGSHPPEGGRGRCD